MTGRMSVDAIPVPLPGDAPVAIARQAIHDRWTKVVGYALLLRDPRAFAERWRWSDALLREVRTLQGLLHDGSEITLYDAGEAVGRQLAPMLRAIGRPEVTIPPGFYDTRALLDGNEIAAAAGIGPGPRLGALKRSLLEAQLRGEVCSREDAERFVKLSASM